MSIYEVMAHELKPLEGYLLCLECEHRQGLGDTALHVHYGWPKHCGYTMRCLTAKEALSNGDGLGGQGEPMPVLAALNGDNQ